MSTISFVTRNDLPAGIRDQVVTLLNERLADAVDLATQAKQAHWNVKGPQFIALHKLFDDVHAGIGEYADLLAERVVQLGGVAEGTARIAAERSSLAEYPLAMTEGTDHVNVLADALGQFAGRMRRAIDETDDLGDGVSADICTEIARGTDKWLWFVEAHAQSATAETAGLV